MATTNMEPWSGDRKYNLPWDRTIRGEYDQRAELMSNLTTALFIAPIYLSYRNMKTEWSKYKEVFTEAVMLSEVILFNSGLNLFTRSLEVWSRPYVYSSKISEEKRAEKTASGSFYSGHAANTFAIATFLTATFNEKYPNHPHTKWLALSSYGVATAVSYFRVQAGKHYPTDVVIGAAIGSFIGWLIPYIHTHDDVALRVNYQGAELVIPF